MSTNSSAEAKSAYITIAANISSKIRCCTDDTRVNIVDCHNTHIPEDNVENGSESETDEISVEVENLDNNG